MRIKYKIDKVKVGDKIIVTERLSTNQAYVGLEATVVQIDSTNQKGYYVTWSECTNVNEEVSRTPTSFCINVKKISNEDKL